MPPPPADIQCLQNFAGSQWPSPGARTPSLRSSPAPSPPCHFGAVRGVQRATPGSVLSKPIWGGEAVAVRHEGRANPNQLILTEATAAEIGRLREALLSAHRERYGGTDDLLIGLQLTHSGRFCRPNRKDRMEPRILYRHPILDRKFGIPPDYPLLTDAEI